MDLCFIWENIGLYVYVYILILSVRKIQIWDFSMVFDRMRFTCIFSLIAKTLGSVINY